MTDETITPNKPVHIRLVYAPVNLGTLPYVDGNVSVGGGVIRRIQYHRDDIVEKFPLLFCAPNLISALEMNLFLSYLYCGTFSKPKKKDNRNARGGVSEKTLKIIANSLRGYLEWLTESNVDWREGCAIADSDRAKAWLPPFRYKTHLIERLRNREISYGTASLYLSHVRRFYEWAVKKKRIDRIPFKYEHIVIKKRRKDGDYDYLFSTVQDERKLLVRTSDLSIPIKLKPKKTNPDDGLNPYSAEELEWLFGSEYMQLENRRLWGQMAVVCGLRVDEMAVFPESAVVNPKLSNTIVYPTKIIGKFNKERTILIPRFLMESLWSYKDSPDRSHRAAKWDQNYGTSSPRPLFINRSGKRINSQSISNVASEVREELKRKGITFARSMHDLRPTFATTLAKFMLEKNLPQGYIQSKLMALLGHQRFSTTKKYIDFARNVTYEDQMKDWVDRIFSDLKPILEREAKEHNKEVFE